MERIIKQYKDALQEGLGLVFIIGILFFLAISPGGKHTTQQFFDGIRITSSRPEVVVVGIDDASLQTIGAWPWNRKVFADLTHILDTYGARAIVYDVLFLEEREGDEMFKKELSQVHAKVILASKVEREKYLSSFLAEDGYANVMSALSNVSPDVDGKVRRYPSPRIEQGSCVRGLGEEAYRIVTFKKNTDCDSKEDAFFRFPENITKYPLSDILSGKIDPSLLKGKTIFIGSTALDLEDHFVGMNGEKIPGVEVHASIFTSLLNSVKDRELTNTEILATLLTSMFLILLTLKYIHTGVLEAITFIALVLLTFLVSYGAFTKHSILPLPWILLTMLLTLGYSTLVRFLKEKKRSEHVQSLFSKYVHKDVLRELMKSPGKLNLTGEKRYLTVLFSDLRGFTTLSEKMAPEKLTSVLNGYFSAMTPIIMDERGTVDKFIGDAVMAFWNAPLKVDHHEERAVHSALRMQDAVAKFNEDNGYTLAAGIGIHAGEAIVGNVGSLERVNYTILGDTVNLASRIEGLTKKYGVKILVTEEVKNKVTDTEILFRKLDVITVKGKSKPSVLYEVMRWSDEAEDMVEDYAIAFNLYQKGNFEEALLLFRDLAKKGDIPSQVMYERIADLEKTEDWDGVWHFEEK